MDLHPQVSGITYFIFQEMFIHLFSAVLGLCCFAQAFSSCSKWALLSCAGFSPQRLLLLQSTGSGHAGCSSWGTQAQSSQLVGLVAPKHVKSSWIRDQTHVPCTGRWILIHCATREVLIPFILNLKDFFSNSSSRVC